MTSESERIKLEVKIMQAKRLAKGVDDFTREKIEFYVAQLEQKLRELNE